MINVNELRRFNKVIFAEDGTVFDVLLIEETGLIVKNEDEEFWCEIDQFDCIPLTEEWLLRMGFVEDKIWKKCFRRGKFEVEFIDNDWRHELLNMVVILDWVHQLQNLHFATMREELEIKK